MHVLLRLLALCALGICLTFAQYAVADDLADEADLHFQLGAEAYQRGDYRRALEQFLVSNRLVPNKNVVFNIARSYEKLGQYPEAYRYYSQALEGESDAGARARIELALEQIRPHVAVVDIRSEPPGATLYVNRRDLGPRGESPRRLGLSPGSYKIIAELSGYEPAEAVVADAKLGQISVVELKLVPILGDVRLIAADRGARMQVRVDDPTSTTRCTLLPCTLKLPPGRHQLFFEQAGRQDGELAVDVVARQTLLVRPRLEPLTGTLVVSTDEPGALIEADGRPLGFTPAIVALPVGEHRLRISLKGFRTVEQSVVVQREHQTRVDAVLTQSEEVIAASRVSQSVEDAPSSVTIIPNLELRAFNYPSIAEAVRGVRGVYQWDDRSYVSLGFRGLGVLGSYGNRVLVLLDGHPTNDDWIGSSYVAYDARTDLADIERIEVVRGPGSVLYGTNAFAGVINLVSRRDAPPGVELGVSAVGDAVARGRARANVALGKNSGVWSSVAGAHSEGRDFFFPEFAADQSGGYSRGADGFNAATVQGRWWWKWLTVQWFGHTYEKRLPHGQYETLLADPRTRQRDSRGLLEARAEPELSKNVRTLTRLYLNHYGFRGTYARLPSDGGVELDTFQGTWWGVEQRVVVSPMQPLQFTVGGEFQHHFQVDQKARVDQPEPGEPAQFLNRSDPFEVLALYGLVDAELSERLRLSAGARLDAYSTFGSSASPRIAVIVRPYDRGNLKILAGRAFRAPSIYELFYNDGGITQIPSPHLRPELIYSFEVEHSHRFSPMLTGTVATFANYVTDLIVQRGSGDAADPNYYQNSGAPLATLGAEVSVRRDWRQGWMLGASYSFAHSRLLASDSLDDLLSLREQRSSRSVANVPEHLAAVTGAVPIIGRQLTAASRLTLQGPRYDRFASESDVEQQRRTETVVLWDVVLSGEEERFDLRYALGVYNAFDWRYSLPVSGEGFRQRVMPQSGRTLLVSADVRF